MRILAPISITVLTALAAALGDSVQDPECDRNIASSANVLPPSTAVEPSGCSTSECHPGIKEHSYLHGPLQVDACDACHVVSDLAQHRFEPSFPRRQLCLACHELPGEHEGLLVHEPVAQGECQACHDPHGSEQPRTILQAEGAGLCLACHQDLTGGRRLVHAPETGGACDTCHAAHSSPRSGLLLRPGRSLCLSCHVETAEQLESAFLAHPPATDDCRVCHDPHASGDEAMLIADPVSLCTTCHEDVGHAMDSATHPHAAMTAEKACLNCHQPHAGDHGQLLRGPTAKLCFQCHDEDVERVAGPTIPSIQAALTESAMVHRPAARGECTICHQVHGGERDRLLKGEYVHVYSAFEDASGYALCFSCHDKNLVLEERTDAITAFRNGDRNLHYVHVNSPKSRSCNICHDPHAANSKHLLRASFPYGPIRWSLAIAWKATPTGGGCAAGCHAPFTYDRATPVEYVREPGDEQAWRGRMPEDSRSR